MVREGSGEGGGGEREGEGRGSRGEGREEGREGVRRMARGPLVLVEYKRPVQACFWCACS